MSAFTPATRELAQRLCTHAASQSDLAAAIARMHNRVAVVLGQVLSARPAPGADAGVGGNAIAAALPPREVGDCMAFIELPCLVLGAGVTCASSTQGRARPGRVARG